MKCSKPKCNHDAVTGSTECRRHTDEASRVRKYRLTNEKFKKRMEELNGVDYLASLEEEVMLAHVMLEERVNAAGDNPAEIISAHNSVMSSLETINRLATNLRKQQHESGEILTRPTLQRLMADVVDVVAEHLEAFVGHPKYAGTVDSIADKVGKLLENVRNEE